MSIIIKGIDMPEDCFECPCFSGEFIVCNVVDKDLSVFHALHKDCPLVEIPTPHGRIVDYDRIFKDCTDLTSAECNPRWYPPIVILEAED